MRNSIVKSLRFLTIIAYLLCYDWAMAQNQKIHPPTKENSTVSPSLVEGQSPFEALKGKREDKSKRDAFSKHYINEDGSFTALIGAGPIHYEKNGIWEDIDHKITPNLDVNYPYANTTNLFESYFGSTTQMGVKNKTPEGEIREFLNTQMYWEVNGQAVNMLNSANIPVRIENDRAYYDNIYGSISAEFTTLTGKRKLNYIIPNKQALGTIPSNAEYLVFSEDIILPFGWTSSMTEKGILIKDQIGKEIYLYENPHSTDAESLALREENTIFESLQIGNTLTVKTKVKTTWLLANERVYPVMVDPTVDALANGGRSVYDDGFEETLGLFGRNNDGYFAYWLQYHIRFDVSSIPSGSTVSATTGYIYKWGNNNWQNTNQWHWSISADPTTTTGLTLYNSASSALSNASNIPSGPGWLNNAFLAGSPLTYVENGINGSGNVSATVRPAGTYGPANFFAARTHNETNKPHLIITYTEPVTDRTLTVSNAYTGASYANGSHTIPNNTSVTATSGTRAGYNIVGWTGTGSVPPSGTGGTVTFTITENSSITWNWEAIKPQFHNYGGTEQLAFNNSKINTANPIFRLSHQGGTANGYRIEISPNPNFSSGEISQTFSGSFPADTENNFVFTSGSFTSGTTYYVRAAVDMGGGYLTDGWTTETYSFTYQDDQEIPSWFQTTQAQFESDVYSGLSVNSTNGGEVVPMNGGNPILNPSFETTGSPAANWNRYGNSWVQSMRTTDYSSEGSVSMGLYIKGEDLLYLGYNSATDNLSVYQNNIDLTNATTLEFELWQWHFWGYGSANTTPVSFQIIVDDNDSNGSYSSGIVIYEKMGVNVEETIYGTQTVDLTTYNFTGNKTIKLVYRVHTSDSANENIYIFYVDNLRVTKEPAGTITSTPIHFASVQDAVSYGTFEWTQTPGSGSLKFDIQGSSDGVNFNNISGYTNIEESSSGVHSLDISDIDPLIYPHLRLVGKLDGDATLHDWSVTFKREECNASTTWDGFAWSNGIPNDLSTKIIINGNFTSDDLNTISGELIGCSMEVVAGNVIISSEHSVTLENEIKIDPSASFTLENNAHLIQISPTVENEGEITVKRISAPMIRQDATGWSSPVAGQNLRNFSAGTLKKRYYIYNGYGPEGDNGSNFKAIFEYDPLYPMPSPIPDNWPGDKLPSNNLFDELSYTFQKGWGYTIRVPNNWSSSTPQSFNAVFIGEPHNGDVVVPAYGKYSLVGNPYPSAIDADEFLQENSNIATLHFWTHHFPVGSPNYNYNYVTYTLAGGAGQYPENAGPQPNGIIALAQALVVEHKTIEAEQSNDSWPVFFYNSMRTNEFANFYKTDFLERHRFWLSLANSNEEKTAQILIGYMTGATQEADHQIDGKRMGTAPLYSLIAGEKYTVQGRALPFDQEDVVPLGFTADESGKFKIQIDRVDGLFAETENSISIYLRDRLKGIEHNLSNSPYEFESSEGEFLERFEIFYKTDETLSVEDELENNSILIYQNSQNIVIQSKTEKILSVELWDLSGRKIHQNLQVNAQVYEMKRKNFDTLILLVKVLTQDGKITTRKIIHSKN